MIESDFGRLHPRVRFNIKKENYYEGQFDKNSGFLNSISRKGKVKVEACRNYEIDER